MRWLVLLLASSLAPAMTLTGLHAFGADASGNAILPTGGSYTHVPNEGNYVLWVAADAIDGPILNRGAVRDEGDIAMPLIPGTLRLWLLTASGISEGQSIFPGPIPPTFGLNLFFDGVTEAAQISVFAPTTTARDNYSAFGGNAGVTVSLSGADNYPGSGALTFSDEHLRVTVTDFMVASPLVFGSDRIANFLASPDGNREWVGMVTMEVKHLPEPSYVIGSVAGLGLMLWTSLALKSRAGSRTAYTPLPKVPNGSVERAVREWKILFWFGFALLMTLGAAIAVVRFVKWAWYL